MLTISRDVFPRLIMRPHDLPAEQQQFNELLTNGLAQHPNITQEQKQRFLDEFVLRDWDEFKDGMA